MTGYEFDKLDTHLNAIILQDEWIEIVLLMLR